MQFVSADQLASVLDFPTLIDVLYAAFRSDITVPLRHAHEYPNPQEGAAATLLLMPAWQAGKYLGVKIITVSPWNGRFDLPAVQGVYLLFDADKGTPLAQLDAQTLTARRTAATSALASRFLSRPESRTLLMVGTGALAPNLIHAHATVRPISRVFIWGRRFEKAKELSQQFSSAPFKVEAIPTIEEVIREADIISCATLSSQALIRGEWLRYGQHLDLVGSFKPNMREADDEAIRRSTIFVDSREAAPLESGDLAIPIQRRIITIASIKADLFQLCRNQKAGRTRSEEITIFKSVGHALEDLAAARLAFEKMTADP